MHEDTDSAGSFPKFVEAIRRWGTISQDDPYHHDRDFDKIAQREFKHVVARRDADIEDARPEIEDRLEKRFARKGNDFRALDTEAREKLVYEEAAFDSQTTIIVLDNGSTVFNHSSVQPEKYGLMTAHASLFHADAGSLAASFAETNKALQSHKLGWFEPAIDAEFVEKPSLEVPRIAM